MTNAEKFKEVFGFEFALAPYEVDCWCPFQRTKCQDTEFDCFEDCVEPFWKSEYKEPKQKIFDFLTATGQGVIEGEKIASAEWIEAIKKIKAEIEAKNTSIEDFADTHGWVNGLTNEHNAHEADLAIITKHTKELMK